jgi:SAM-dependent methyltransferase
MPTAEEYEAWYHTPRGTWIGETEFRLLCELLRCERGKSLLDVGCGTGYFTRRFAREAGLQVVGLDPNSRWLDFARAHAGGEQYCLGSALCLPFADKSFDYTVSVTALCFIEDARRALEQIVSVTRKRFAIGLLNRHSLLYLHKGHKGGTGAYRGAHWHTASEIKQLLDGLPVAGIVMRSAVFLPSAGPVARAAERMIAQGVRLGAFIAVAADVR